MQEGIAYLFNLTGSYGLAIIFLTIAVRIVLLPFTVLQTRSTTKMQSLQPEISVLQKKYKSDPERLNKETMDLWRKNKVNPLSGCLLLLVQFPFLIAFFQALDKYEPLKTATFLMWNLGQPDKFVLPLLAAASTFVQTRVSTAPGDTSQQSMMYIFPILIGWMATRFAAALSLYWVISNLWSIVERIAIGKIPVAKGEAGQT
ncbi:MAG: membrane protein insertase YidC [Firmicutes bacterium]|nr:membrane protein insertase YidC [Bacillota bacterium]